MTRNAEDDIKKINTLRQRVKTAVEAAAGARVHHEQAQEDLEVAKTAARDLGIDPDNQRVFERWLDSEASEIEKLIEKAETNLNHAQEALGD